MDLSEMVAVFFFHASTPVNNFVYISVIFIAFDNMNTAFECYANNYDHSDKIAMESIFFSLSHEWYRAMKILDAVKM